MSATDARPLTCANHPLEAAVTRCTSCGRRLCAACWRRDVDGKPWCELCIHHLTATGAPLALAIVFFVASLTIIYAGLRWQLQSPGDPSWVLWISVFVGALLGAVFIASRQASPHGRRIEQRRVNEEPSVVPNARVGHPYRAALWRSARIVASPVSGRTTAMMLFACMVVVAIAVPKLLALPRWMEIELVLGTWWLAWAAVLTALLYRGWHLSDDHVLASPRIEWPSDSNVMQGCDAASGCGEVVFAAIVLLLTLLASWLIVELVLPALLFFVYLLIRSALARVANDDHGCEGRLGRALLWGSFWTTLYALPFAVAVYGIHLAWSA